MANEVRIPVRLEVLQDSISNLQKILNGLQPNTANFKMIEKIIQQMTSEAQKLQIQLSKPFNSEGQFRTTNKTIDKLEESAARIQVIMSQLKFSDLKLTPEQQDSFNELNNKISEIRTNYEQFVAKIKEGVMSNSANKSMIEDLFGGSGALKANFDDIKAAVDKHVADLESAAQKEKAAYEEMRSNAELASRARVLTTTGKGISRETIGESLFDKYLYDNNGQMGFKLFGKGSGSAAFLQALEQEFKLDPGALKELVGKSFDEINKAFQEMGEKGNFNPFQGLIKAFNSGDYLKKQTVSKTTIESLKSQLEEYRRLQTELAQLQKTQVGPADTKAQTEIDTLKTSLSTLEDQILKTMAASTQMNQPFSQMASGCSQLRTALEQANAQFIQMQRTTQSFNQMKMAIVNFMGFNQVLNLTKRAVNEAMNHIKELDSVMNKISIVTDMSTGDLWGQIDQYSKMAQSYGVSIKGAYEVSQIYYQQGLDTANVMTLTNETLKLAKISGLDYAQTTDYMTTALRGFKMEMSEASTVVDVYSNLAAHTAVSQEELAVAMSKTASSMEGVGATFQEASAMIATMVAVTRESATNIGSAMKSIASRYGELTKDPTKLVDEDGEAMAFNKVDAALQSVGISMKTVDGQFREFTDVIVELGEKWSELDSTQQRYIATQFAGNRQQSRFLALVSNVDLLKSNLNYAENSEDVGTLQALKALDSVEAKLEQVKVAYQQFYTTIGAESVWKGLLDGTTNVINTLNSLPKLFGKIPIGAIAAITSIISVVKSVGMDLLNVFAQTFGKGILQGMLQSQDAASQGAQSLVGIAIQAIKGKKGEAEQAGKEFMEAAAKGMQEGASKLTPDQLTGDKRTQYDDLTNKIKALEGYKNVDVSSLSYAQQQKAFIDIQNNLVAAGAATYKQFGTDNSQTIKIINDLLTALEQERAKLLETGNAAEESAGKFQTFINNHKNLGNGLQSFGSAINMIAMAINTTSEGGKTLSGVFQALASTAMLAGAAIKIIDTETKTIPWMAIASGILTAINAISTLIVTPEEKLEELTKKAEELNNQSKQIKADYATLDRGLKQIEELEKKRYDSAEATEEYTSAVNDLTATFPALIAGFDESGNAILDASNSERILALARQKSAQAAYDAAESDFKRAQQQTLVDQQAIETAKNNLKNNSYKTTLESMGLDYYNQEEKIPLTEYRTYQQAVTSAADAVRNLSEFESDESQAVLNQYKTAILNLAQVSGTLDPTAYLKDLNTLLKATNQVQLDIFNEKGYAKGLIGNWQNLHQTYSTDSYLTSDYASTLVNEAIYNAYQSSDSKELNEEIIASLDLSTQASTLMQSFWSGLSDEYRDKFDLMMQEQENYSSLDFAEVFQDIQGFDNIFFMIQDYYKEKTTNIAERLNAALAQALGQEKNDSGKYNEVDYTKLSNGFYKEFSYLSKFDRTEVEEKYLNKILSSYQNLKEQGFSERAEGFGIQALDLFKQIDKAPAEIEAQLWEVINSNGLNTLEGIQKIRDTIKNNESLQGYIDDQTLTNLENNIIPNINLEIQAATSELLENWEDVSKDLSKAMSSGMTIKEADELITKAESLGVKISLSDFDTSGDKLILTAEKFNEYFASLRESASITSDKWGNEIENANKTLSKAKQGFQLAEDDLANIKAIAPNFDFKKYYITGAKTLTTEGIEALMQAIAESQQSLNDYNEYSKIAAQQIAKSWNWSQGNYFDFKVPGKDNNTTVIYESVVKDIQALQQKITEDAVKHISKADDPETRALLDNVYKSYDTFLSDVLSKGFENIHLEDYEGLVKGHISQAVLTGSYETFVRNYGAWAGRTVKEMNELLAQAIEKDNEVSSTSLLKDLTFFDESRFGTSLAGLKDFANKVGLKLDQILDSAIAYYNEVTDQYEINIKDLVKLGANIDLDATGMREAIRDSVNTFQSDLVKLINNGLSGTLTNEDALKLTQQARSALGVNLGQESFTISTDGLKLANDAIFSLYANLKRMNPLLASKVLPSIQKLSDRYNDLAQINQDLAEATGDAEIALRDLANAKAPKSENDFKFTENGTVPTMWKWAEAFYEDIYKAGEIIKTSKTTQTMDPTSFARLLNPILANVPTLKFGAKGTGNDHTAQEWIDLVSKLNATKIDENGNYVIDFKALGFNDLDDFLNAYTDAMQKIQQQQLSFEQAHNKMVAGTKQFKLENYIDAESGKLLNANELKKKLPKEIQDALEQISIEVDKGNGEKAAINFKELLLGDEKTWKEYGFTADDILFMFKKFGSTDWQPDKMSEQLAEMFGNRQDIVTTVKPDGTMTVEYQMREDQIVTVFKIGNHELGTEWGKKAFEQWGNLSDLVHQGLGEIDQENGIITVEIDGQTIQAQLNFETGEFTYTAEINGIPITTHSYEQLLRAIKAGATKTVTPETLTSDETVELNFDGQKIKVTFDENGKIEVVGGLDANNPQYEEIKAQIEEHNAKIQEQLDNDKSNEVEVPSADVKTNEINVIVDDGTVVQLAAGNKLILSKPLERIITNVTKLVLTPLETQLASVPIPKKRIPELTGIVTKLIAVLTNKEADTTQIDEVWNSVLTKEYQEDEKQVIIGLLNIALGTKSVNDSEVQTALQAYQILPIDQKTAILSSILLALRKDAISGDVAKADFDRQVTALLTATNVPIESIGIIISAFKATEASVANSGLDETSKTTIQTAVDTALANAAITGNVELAKLMIIGFSQPSINPEDINWGSLINEDGTINLGTLNDMAAQATIKKLSLMVENLNTEDIESEQSEEGIVLHITGATAVASGLSKVTITDKDITAVDSEGNAFKVPVSPELGALVKTGFDGTEYTAEQLIAKVLALLDPQQLNEAWEKWKQANSSFNVTPNVTEGNQDSGEKFRAGLYGYTQKGIQSMAEWLGENGSFLNTINDYGLIDSSKIISGSDLDKYLMSLQSLVESGQALSSIDLTNLTNLSVLLDNDDNTRISDILDADKINKADLEAAVKNLSALSAITGDNLAGLAANISALSMALSILQNVNIDKVISTLNQLKEISSGEDLVTKLNLELDISDTASNGFETLNSAIAAMGAAAQTASTSVAALAQHIASIPASTTHDVNLSITVTEAAGAKGNVTLTSDSNIKALSFAQGTLMGELGPELVVTNGHYFVVGQGGAEMVDLPKDAIVFNHLQTESLLKNGHSSRGKAVTNERNAAGMAHATGDADYWQKRLDQLRVEYATLNKKKSLQISGFKGQVPQDVIPKLPQIKKLNKQLDEVGRKITEAQKELEKVKEATTKDTEQRKKDSTKTKSKNTANMLHPGYGTVRRKGSDTDGKGSGSGSGSGWKGKPGDGLFSGDPKDMFKPKLPGAKTSDLSDKAKKAIKSVITELFSKGFEGIDLDSDTFKDLPDDIKAEMKKYISGKDASYVEFLKKYKDYLDMTVSEFNQQYLDAWQKDHANEGISDDILSAAEGLTFFAGRRVGGSKDDWVTLFGDYTDVQQLIEDKVLEWDENLRQWIVTDIENLKEYGTDLDIDAFKALQADSIRSSNQQIADWLESGLQGSLSNTEFKKLQSYLKNTGVDGISEDLLKQTRNGLQISAEAAAHLYAQLKSVNREAANLVFDKLSATLTESNDKFKTMTALLGHIQDLQNKINDTTKYNDARIKQYKEELALAQEIAAVRATTEDDSMNFLDQDIPASLNNPLNYINNWITAMKNLRTSMSEGSPMDFKQLYNLAKEMNGLASVNKPMTLLGQTLDGTAESLSKFTTAMAKALGSDKDGNFGVLLSKMGTSLTDGTKDYATSADSAMHTMAKAQIAIIDGLIAYFEGIVAMEKLGKIDVNLDKILSIDEIFKDSKAGDKAKEFTKQMEQTAKELLATLKDNKTLNELAKTIKIGPYTIKQLIEDATDGVRNLTKITAKEYTEIMNAFYQMVISGDYDLDNISQSLKDAFEKAFGGLDKNIDLGDKVINLKYNTVITKKDGKYYTSKGTEYETLEDAQRAEMLEQIADVKNIEVEHGVATGTIEVNGEEITVKADKNGTKYYYKNKPYDSMDAVYKAMWLETNPSDKKSETEFEKWKVKVGITPEVTVDSIDTSKLTSAQKDALLGKTAKDLEKAWSEDKVTFQVTYGFTLGEDGKLTEEQLEELKKKAGIETQRIELSAYIKKLELDEGVKGITLKDGSFASGLTLDTKEVEKAIEEIEKLLEKINNKTIKIDVTDNASSVIKDLQNTLNNLRSIEISVKQKTGDTPKGKNPADAKGNVALAAGRTLMGELGPELVVSNGKYYTVGNNGAEFVNLPKDAIVFNHLQTKRLLSNGSSGRGVPAVSEAAAVSMATGNALASAAEALATLKTLRAMWQSLAESSVKDLIGTTTSSGDSGSSSRTGAWLAQVERWYDLLQKIARLEKQINTYEAERNALQSSQYTDGKRLFELDQATLNNYKEQGAAQKQLAEEYKERFEVRRKELNATAMSQFYTYDEYGQLKFDKEGFAKLQSIRYQTDEGKTLSPIQQFELFNKYTGGAFDKYSKLDSSGLLIEREEDETDESYYKRRVEAGWERIEAEKTELQELWDAYNESTQKYYDAINKGNEVLNRILDNQRELEDKVLDAIEKREQAAIDALSKEREALSKSTESYIKGLSDALTKERSMYEKSDNATELNKLRRQLNILQRSGGSASQIADLQSQISQKDREAYFDAQQDSIDAVQDASDLQLEKMQNQIDLMTETLEYQKANGLLWAEVNDIMKHDSEYITDFITGNDDSWLSKSTLAQQQELNTLNSSVQQWIGYRDQADETMRTSMTNGFQSVVDEFRALHPIISAAGELGDSDSKNPYIHEGDYNYNPATAGSKSSGSDSTGDGTQLSLSDYLTEDKKAESKTYSKTAHLTIDYYDKEDSKERTKHHFSKTATGSTEDEARKKAIQLIIDRINNYYNKADYAKVRFQSSSGNWHHYSDDTLELLKKSIQFRLGGDVNETGLAMLHGTELHPETVLSAPATQQWKTEITGKRNTSLMSRLAELGNVLAGIEKVSNSHIDKETDSSISIENASVNMYVDQIANDYDARRAGNQALEKILEVARKSNGNNRIGR